MAGETPNGVDASPMAGWTEVQSLVKSAGWYFVAVATLSAEAHASMDAEGLADDFVSRASETFPPHLGEGHSGESLVDDIDVDTEDPCELVRGAALADQVLHRGERL